MLSQKLNLLSGKTEQFKAYMTLCDYIVEAESCAGLSNYGLLISRKRKTGFLLDLKFDGGV